MAGDPPVPDRPGLLRADRRDDPQRQKVALVATAHYLAPVMWAMLRHGTAWREGATRAA